MTIEFREAILGPGTKHPVSGLLIQPVKGVNWYPAVIDMAARAFDYEHRYYVGRLASRPGYSIEAFTPNPALLMPDSITAGFLCDEKVPLSHWARGNSKEYDQGYRFLINSGLEPIDTGHDLLRGLWIRAVGSWQLCALRPVSAEAINHFIDELRLWALERLDVSGEVHLPWATYRYVDGQIRYLYAGEFNDLVEQTNPMTTAYWPVIMPEDPCGVLLDNPEAEWNTSFVDHLEWDDRATRAREGKEPLDRKTIAGDASYLLWDLTQQLALIYAFSDELRIQDRVLTQRRGG